MPCRPPAPPKKHLTRLAVLAIDIHDVFLARHPDNGHLNGHLTVTSPEAKHLPGTEGAEEMPSTAGSDSEGLGGAVGEDGIATLRDSLDRLVGDATAGASPLQIGLEPYPDGWRASRRQPDQLAHYPMILHRGGFPNGS